MTKPRDCLNDCGDDPHNAKAARALAADANNRAARAPTVECLANLLVTAVLKGDTVVAGGCATMLHQRRASLAVLTQALLEHCQAAQPPLPDPGWTTEGDECWSANGENFNCDTLEELLKENDQLKPGDTVHVGQAVHPDPGNYVDADDVIDDASNRGYEDGGEFADDYPGEISEEAKNQLNNFLRAWLRTHCAPSFWAVENERPYVLTAADFAGRQTNEAQS